MELRQGPRARVSQGWTVSELGLTKVVKAVVEVMVADQRIARHFQIFSVPTVPDPQESPGIHSHHPSKTAPVMFSLIEQYSSVAVYGVLR